MIRTLLIAAALAAASSAAAAQGHETLGFGVMMNNDIVDDRRDRWHTGGVTISLVRGTGWDGDLPDRPGAIVEFRFRGDIVTPEQLVDPVFPDRLYAGTFAAGAHLHFAWQGVEVAAGADIAAIGDQTGLHDLQSRFHDRFGFPPVMAGEYQVDDQWFLNLTAELGREIELVPGASLRPFAELQAGVETLARAGIDLTFGSAGRDALLVRDVVTGQRYTAIRGTAAPAFGVVLGGDIAHVFDSHYLPGDRGFVLEETRYRLRTGIQADFAGAAVFAGVTYLSEEYDSQAEGQAVGSLSAQFRF